MRFFLCFLFVFKSLSVIGQVDSISIKNIDEIKKPEIVIFKEKNPMRAALYSAIIPGLGQAYNKKYWKIPIIWSLIGIGTGFMVYNNENRNTYHDAFIAEINNQPHKFSGVLDANSLAKGIDLFRRQLDYAIVLTSLLYILNIFDANVDAHLSEFDKQFSLSPVFNQSANENIGLKFKFKL